MVLQRFQHYVRGCVIMKICQFTQDSSLTIEEETPGESSTITTTESPPRNLTDTFRSVRTDCGYASRAVYFWVWVFSHLHIPTTYILCVKPRNNHRIFLRGRTNHTTIFHFRVTDFSTIFFVIQRYICS